MKKFYHIISYILITFTVVGQSNVRLNNYWGDMHFISPASIYDKYDAVFSMAARKQWLGIEGSPTSYFASATTYSENFHTQLGLSLFQDKVGYTSTTNVNLSYAYAVMLKYNWQLHLGLAGNFQALSYDLSKVSLVSGGDAAAYRGLVPANVFDADVGAEITNNNYKIGLVGQNLFALFPSERKLQVNTNFAYAKYYQNTNHVFNLGAGVCGIQYANIYQLELNMTGYFKYKLNNGLTEKPDLFDLGFFYRTQSEAGLIFGFNITDAIHVSYSYDYHFGALRMGSWGTNELMITYNLARKPVCHNCWY